MTIPRAMAIPPTFGIGDVWTFLSFGISMKFSLVAIPEKIGIRTIVVNMDMRNVVK